MRSFHAPEQAGGADSRPRFHLIALLRHTLSSIRNRLIAILTLVPLLVMLLFFAITSSNMTQIVNKRIYDSFFLALEMRANELRDMLDTAYELTVDISYDGSPVADQLDEILTGRDAVSQAKMQSYIEKTFNTYIHSSPSIGLIALIDLDNDEALISSERLTRADLDDVLTPLTTWRRATVYAPHESLSRFKNNVVISLCRPFTTVLKERHFAVYIESSTHFMEELLDPLYDVNDETFHMDKALLDGAGVIRCSSDETLLPCGASFHALSEGGALADYRILYAENSGWTFVGAVNESYYHGVYFPLYLQGAFLLTACLALFILLALLIWRQVYGPIREFAQEIRAMKPSELYTPRSSSAELNEFRTQFNQMRDDIRRLVSQTEAETKKNAELENELLLSRINPHFLHNTLDNIKWLARRDGQDEVAEMLAALNGLIYYNLGKQQLTTLRDELNAMDGYLFLQKRIRPFEYRREISVGEETLALPAPCYTLQPLVENSLRHAWRDGLILTVSVSEDARYVYIRVIDNGRGMDAETLERLRALARATDPQDGGIGLRYVFRALKMMYASGVHIEIDSAPDEGTAITITIER